MAKKPEAKPQSPVESKPEPKPIVAAAPEPAPAPEAPKVEHPNSPFAPPNPGPAPVQRDALKELDALTAKFEALCRLFGITFKQDAGRWMAIR